MDKPSRFTGAEIDNAYSMLVNAGNPQARESLHTCDGLPDTFIDELVCSVLWSPGPGISYTTHPILSLEDSLCGYLDNADICAAVQTRIEERTLEGLQTEWNNIEAPPNRDGLVSLVHFSVNGNVPIQSDDRAQFMENFRGRILVVNGRGKAFDTRTEHSANRRVYHARQVEAHCRQEVKQRMKRRVHDAYHDSEKSIIDLSGELGFTLVDTPHPRHEDVFTTMLCRDGAISDIDDYMTIIQSNSVNHEAINHLVDAASYRAIMRSKFYPNQAQANDSLSNHDKMLFMLLSGAIVHLGSIFDAFNDANDDGTMTDGCDDLVHVLHQLFEFQ